MRRIGRAASLLLLMLMAALWPLGVALAENVNVSVGVGDTTTLIQGDTSPNALVTFMDGNAVIGTTTSNGSGAFSKLFVSQTPGLHTYRIVAEDTSHRTTDTVSISTNVQEHQQTTVTAFLPPTIELSDNEVEQGTPVTIQGSTVPNAQVIVNIDDNPVIAQADGSGEWQYVLDTSTLGAGEHQIYAVAVKSGGAHSYPTEVRTLVVQSKPSPEEPPTPTEPPATPPHKPKPPTITSPKPGSRVTGDCVPVKGTAEPGTQIEVWNRGRIIGSTFADSHGNWSLCVQLKDFSNELTVRACRDNVCSAFSRGLKLFRENPPPTKGLSLRLSAYRLRGFTLNPLVVTAHISGGEVPYRLVVDWGDGQKTTLDRSNSRQLLTHRYANPGSYNGTVTVTDAEGRVARVFFSAAIKPLLGPVGSWVSSYIVPAVVVSTVVAASAVFAPSWWQGAWRGIRFLLKRLLARVG